MKRAVFLDRDGTINIEKNYLYRVEDFEYLEGAKEALVIFQNLGYELVIITNQSGIARGFYSEADYHSLADWLKQDLLSIGVRLGGQYYCPHLITAQVAKYAIACDCRKPKIGLFLKAVKDLDIDLNGSVVIGDKSRDVEICRTPYGKEMRGFLIYSKESAIENNVMKISGGLMEVAKILTSLE